MTATAYLDAAARIIDRTISTQLEAIEAAGALIAGALAGGHRLWAFGTGHSHLLAEELYARAGGLADVHAVLEPALMLHEGPEKSSALERLPGLARVLIETRDMREGDVVVIASNSGRNAVPVEFAEEWRARGGTVVAITSMAHTASVPSRAPSGRRLCEVADVVIDNGGVPGDALVPIGGRSAGATSTAIGALIVQAIVCHVAALLDARGLDPGLLRSFNLDPREDEPAAQRQTSAVTS
ncbi:SIS domain-containing protein [Nonomuraea soli]|uniref:Putative phosphosugar-binding protein n=1 Tax=Nonomuraea soli TaxID=1032476 RepID=A0A7W0CRX9_9ACTN|nr:SIS domain-containing protein [Nonomuraea soli]MBA2896162.1 putative phosphosugar-binding protein [Nonomuraea soli]